MNVLLYVKCALLVTLAALICYWLWRRFICEQPLRKRHLTSSEQYGIEYTKLLTAVMNDHRVAARLINHEHANAGPAGIGKAEAVRRALDRLTQDRSRGQWR